MESSSGSGSCMDMRMSASLGAVVGDFEYVVLGVADDVRDEALCDFEGSAWLGPLGGLDRAEEVVELLLDLGDEVPGGAGRGGFQIRLASTSSGQAPSAGLRTGFYGLALLRLGVV